MNCFTRICCYFLLLATWQTAVVADQWLPILNTPSLVEVFAADENGIYAGTYDNGLFKSTDQGASWAAINNGLTNLKIHVLLTSYNQMYAGTAKGLFKTTDGGANWQAENKGLTDEHVRALTRHKDQLYLGTESGRVFKTDSNYLFWQDISQGLPHRQINALLVTDDALYAAMTEVGLFKAANQAGEQQRWVPIPELMLTTVEQLADNNGTLYAATSQGLFSSRDGHVWSSLTSEIADPALESLFVTEQSIYISTRQKQNFKSMDNGQHWQLFNEGLPSASIQAFLLDQSHLYAATSVGIFKSQDQGLNWQRTDSGLSGAYVRVLLSEQGQLYAGTDEGIFQSQDNGIHWEQLNTNSYVSSMAIHRDTMYLGTYMGDILASSDRGQSWSSLTAKHQLGPLISALAVNDKTLYAGTGDGAIFQSDDGGKIWNRILESFQTPIRQLTLSQHNLYVTTHGLGLLEATGRELDWSVLYSSMTRNGNKVEAFAMSQNEMYAGTYGEGIFKSTDHGDTWQAINQGLTNLFIQAIAVQDHNIYVGTYEGVFKSSNGGASWLPINTGLSDMNVQRIATHDNDVYLGTNTGVFKMTDGTHLRGLGLYPAIMTHAFNSQITSYQATLYAGENFIQVTPVLATEGATLTINGIPAASGSPTVIYVQDSYMIEVEVQFNGMRRTYFIALEPGRLKKEMPLLSLGTSKNLLSDNCKKQI